MRRISAALLAALILIGGFAALASGGGASDPLISLSYVTDTYIPDVVKQAEERVDTAVAGTYDTAAARLKAQADLYLAKAGALKGEGGYAETFTEQRFKRGDVITIDTGSELMLLAGGAVLSYDSGTVVDVTDGSPVPTGTALISRHRYLAAEDTLCRVTVTTDTAVLAPQGFYALTGSGEVDYNQLAGALKAMGLFKGTGTAFGDGYDLEAATTRIEGIILFLRLVGEEQTALAYTGECPFSDVPDWGRAYVSYAYSKGYTKGVDEEHMLFGSMATITSGEYLTFVLRALGYRDSGENPDFTWENALERAQTFGCITAGEKLLLTEKPFLRAQVAYVSYYCLSAPRKAGGTLRTALTSSGVLSAGQVKAAMDAVTVQRIG